MKKIIGDVKLDDLHLREIPEILNDVHIEGDVHITDNHIRNLNNFPLYTSSNVTLSSFPMLFPFYCFDFP